MSPDKFDLFMALHRDLPRQGPGEADVTREALARIPDLPQRPRIVDLGCGPGAQTLHLLEAVEGSTVVAVDLMPQMLEELRARAAAAHLSDRLTLVLADMGAPPREEVPPASFHLVWSESAAYAIGFERALRTWRHLLLPGGFIAVSELAWLIPPDEAPEAARTFWATEYPAMRSRAENNAVFESAGFELASSFVLPPSAWDAYYRPLEARLEGFAETYADTPLALEVVEDTRKEIDVRRRYGESFGYVFHVGRMR